MLQNPCKTLGFMKNMVYKIPPGGGGKPYPASGLSGKPRQTGSLVRAVDFPMPKDGSRQGIRPQLRLLVLLEMSAGMFKGFSCAYAIRTSVLYKDNKANLILVSIKCLTY